MKRATQKTKVNYEERSPSHTPPKSWACLGLRVVDEVLPTNQTIKQPGEPNAVKSLR